MSRAKITVLLIVFAIFLLPALVLLWTGIFGAYYNEGVVIPIVMLFVVGVIISAIILAEME